MLLSAPRSLLLLPSEAPAEAARTLALLRAAAQRLQVPAVSLNSANWRVGLATGRNQLVAACPLGDADLKALPAGTTVFLVIDRKSVVEGKGVSVRVGLGGHRIIKTTK